MTVEIRLLGSGDGSVLEHVAPDAFDDPIDPRAATEFLADERHHISVAIDEGFVVGFVSAVHYVHPDKPRAELWINEVSVASSHRQRGLGRELVTAILDDARDRGCSEAWVLTNRTNEAAMKLYAGCGGEPAPDEAVMFTFYLNK